MTRIVILLICVICVHLWQTPPVEKPRIVVYKSARTWGCVALENEDMKELYDAVSVGTPVTIKP